ncbi:ABC-F family ATP-binding cassette domain-containing protein [Weeksellaceae bacterium KMM 9713]|uniref:ABC-F family ATP-binding cassette domain-containing protein n=1 Tax=Profundicola chukchiensis TaxID=2961959 RepID=A0A9X4RXP1_9FLAO|nr:ABC-F family ATP-binding cassette domain-containing protein [Profundicola chukchiensis]MDG4946844.1 ABC-F family ATP-binding cassette domain-containing protein [Profundicola chukchiensis]
MTFATITNLTKSYGIRTLFEDVNFIVNQGDNIAIVAKNGSGKSTLLKIIQGVETPDSGEVEIHRGIDVYTLEQGDDFDENLLAKDIIYAHDNDVLQLLNKYQSYLNEGISDQRLIDVMTQIDEANAWNVESLFEEIFSNLKIDFLNQKIGSLSGGQRKRISLAKFLIDISIDEGHQLLILDEPTNHLDIEMVEWLEYFINKENRTLLLVTHDRYFLDSICTQILELEDQTIYVHRGDYETYVTNKANRIENLQANIDKAKNLYRKELEWMRRQPKARTTKSKSREQSFYKTEEVAKRKIVDQNLLLEMQMTRLGKKIVEFEEVSFAYGDKKILDNYSNLFARGQKIGIIGKNGVGKSTFLKILEGDIQPDSGEIDRGDTLVFGHFKQDGISYKLEQRVIDFVTDIAENFPLANGGSMSASQFLQLFLFEPQQQYTPISRLSGGEKKRLQLLSVLYKNPNFLILDEPTNDLDLPTLTILEQFLNDYSGCLLIVSHDRYFMDKVVDELMIFDGQGKISTFYGTYTEYFLDQKAQQLEASKQKSEEIKQQPKPKSNENKLTYNEQKEFKQIEKDLPKLEEKRKELEAKLTDTSLDLDKITEISEKYQQIKDKIEEAEMRWLELSEKEAN